MTQQPNDFMRSIQELITNSATDQIRTSRQFNDLVQSISRGELDDQEARARITQFLTEATSQYINDLSQLTVSFFQALRTVNRHYSDHFFDHVRGPSYNNGQPTENGSGTLQRVEMNLSAAVGDDVQRSFVIENKQNQPYDVSFAVSEFTGEGGSESFRAPLQLQPSRFTLRPGDEQVIHLSLPLLPELFAPGRRYECSVLVRGYQNLMLALVIDVQPQARPDVGIREVETPIRAQAAARPDRLTALKGIGPNYEKALVSAGIARFADLAHADDSRLEAALGAGGLSQAQRYDWRGQARLAAADDRAGLQALQARLPLT